MFRSRALLSAIIPLLFVGQGSATEQPSEQRHFYLPAGELEQALRQFAQQIDIELLYIPVQVRGERTEGVRGEYSPQAALEILIRNTQLEVRKGADGALVIAPRSTVPIADATRAPGAIRLAATPFGTQSAPANGADESEPIEQVVVQGTTIDDPILSSRTGDTLRERPQSVSILTRERLDEQNLTSLSDALVQTTGVTTVMANAATTRFYSRGFEIGSFQLDGGAPVVFNTFRYTQLPDLAIFEQVEVTRGPDALFSGNGEPGGTIQLLRKRPTGRQEFSTTLSAGRWDNYRATFDIDTPMAFDGRLGGRVVGVLEDRGTFFENGNSKHSLLYGTTSYEWDRGTRLSLGAMYDDVSRNQGGAGLPRYADGGDLRLPRSVNLSAEWADQDIDSLDVFASLEHPVTERWQVRINANRNRQDAEYDEMFAYGHVNRSDGTGVSMVPYTTVSRVTQEGVDATLRGGFTLFHRDHKISIGADWQRVRSDIAEGGPEPVTDIDVFNFDPGAVPRPDLDARAQYEIAWGQEQSGFYISANFELSKRLHLLGGARLSRYQYSDIGDMYDRTTGEYQGRWETSFSESDVLTPNVGLTFDASTGWTLYGSVSESYASQASLRAGPYPGSPLDPISGRNYELGIKGGLWEGKAAAQFAVYRIDRNGEAIFDRGFPSQGGPNGSACCYRAQGKVESEGLDLEVNGTLIESINMFAGYTFNQNRYKAGYDVDNGTIYMPQTPKHLFRLWMTWQPRGAMSRWNFSTGINAQTGYDLSGTSVTYDPQTYEVLSETPYQIRQPGYMLLGARAEFALSRGWSIALNADNLLDKRYYQAVGDTQGGNWYGTPRSFMVVVQGKFR